MATPTGLGAVHGCIM
jgi:WD40 repeat protein